MVGLDDQQLVSKEVSIVRLGKKKHSYIPSDNSGNIGLFIFMGGEGKHVIHSKLVSLLMSQTAK